MARDGSARDVAHPVAAVGAVMAGLVAMGLVFKLLDSAGMSLRATMLFSELALAFPSIIVASVVGPVPDVLAVRPLRERAIASSLLAGTLLWLASLGLMELQSLVWAPDPRYLDEFARLHAALRPRNALDAAYSILCIALVPAAAEELVFRGLVLPSLASRLGVAAGVWASSLLFAAIHLDAYRFPFTLAVGLGLALLRLRAGSLLPAMIAHAVINAATFAAVPLLDDVPAAKPESHPVLGTVLLLAGVGGLVLALRAMPKAPNAALMRDSVDAPQGPA